MPNKAGDAPERRDLAASQQAKAICNDAGVIEAVRKSMSMSDDTDTVDSASWFMSSLYDIIALAGVSAYKSLAGNQASTEVSSAPAASPAQEEKSSKIASGVSIERRQEEE